MGDELHDELAGEFGLKCVPMGGTGVQWGSWFNKEINSGEDLRVEDAHSGLGGDVVAKLGASPITPWWSEFMKTLFQVRLIPTG